MHARNSSEVLLALDSIQARSQVLFFYGEVRSKKETDQMRPEGQAFSGGELWLSETEVQDKFTIWGAGVELESVDMCHLGLSGGMLPRNI